MRHGLVLTGIGIALELIAAVMLTRVMASLLYQVGAHDFMTFALTPVVFLAIALFATYLPARQATRADPAEALKEP